jgi:hypothetical protein
MRIATRLLFSLLPFAAAPILALTSISPYKSFTREVLTSSDLNSSFTAIITGVNNLIALHPGDSTKTGIGAHDSLTTASTATITIKNPLVFYDNTDSLVVPGHARLDSIETNRVSLSDNEAIRFGTGFDVDLKYNATDLVLNLTVAGAGDLVVNNGSIELDDSEGTTYGTGKDATIRYDATNLVINPKAVGSGVLQVTGDVDVTGTTEATSTTAAALKTAGGLGVAGDIYAGDDIFLTATGVLNWGAGDVTVTGGTNTLTVAGGDLVVNTVTGANAAGPAFIGDEAATATNPTLVPNKTEEDTGIGWASADVVTVVTGGAERVRIQNSLMLFPSGSALAPNTADASDNGVLHFAGGGSAGYTRGATLFAYGNEHATEPGEMWLRAGNVAGGDIVFQTGSAVEALRIDAAGATTVTGGLVAVNITSSGLLDITNTTESTSTVTGSIHTDGGLGVAGDIYAGDDIFLTATGVLNWGAGDVTVTGGTNTLTVAGGDLVVNTVTGANAAGPAFIGDEAATATNPTLVPNKTEEDTGIGWASADVVTVVTGGAERVRIQNSLMLFPSGSALAPNTADASDNGVLHFAGGGSAGYTRGATLFAYGNEHATEPGEMWLRAGNVAGGDIVFQTGSAVEALRIDAAGATTVTGGLVAVNITSSGLLDITNTTESTSTVTGSIHTDGGLGVAGDIYAGDDIFFTTGAVQNYGAGNFTATHSAGALAFSGTISAATGSTVGNLTLANGSITDSGGALSFGNENVSTTGTLASGALTVTGAATATTTFTAASDLAIGTGSVTSVSGAISFGNENLTTTGTLAAGATTISGLLTAQAGQRITSNAATGSWLDFYNTVVDAGNRNWSIVQNAAVYGDLHFLVSAAADGNPRSGATSVLQMTSAGRVGINETANANMTTGLTINQGTNDDEIFALKSSDVGHGMTVQAETDTYFEARKISATLGGSRLSAYSETGQNYSMMLRGIATDETATRTTSGQAPVVLMAGLKSTTTATAISADQNLVVISNFGTTRFIFDSDGDSHQDVGTAWTNFDHEEDAMVVRSIGIVMDPGSIVKSEFDDWNRDHKEDLIRTGLIPRLTPEQLAAGEQPLMNTTQLARLHNGAIWQNHERIMTTAEKLYSMEEVLSELREDNIAMRKEMQEAGCLMTPTPYKPIWEVTR